MRRFIFLGLLATSIAACDSDVETRYVRITAPADTVIINPPNPKPSCEPLPCCYGTATLVYEQTLESCGNSRCRKQAKEVWEDSLNKCIGR